MAYRWNGVLRSITSLWTRSVTSTPRQTDTLEVGADRLASPGPPARGASASGQRTRRVVSASGRLALSGSALSTSYSLFSLQTLQTLGFIFCSFYSAFRGGRGFFFFKGYGCSKTERIRKWLGALSNALLKVHYKDE